MNRTYRLVWSEVHGAFVAALDRDVIALLMRLEREPAPAAITRRDGEAPHPLPRPFFASVRNYNRLAALPPQLRERRMQALLRFPALVAPILLTAHRYANAFDGKRHAWRERDEAVEAAIDQGRDLSGALAAHYGISRGLVRAPVNAEYWIAPSHKARRGWLALLDDLPDNQRPSLAEFERWQVCLANYFALIGEDDEANPPPQPPGVHRGAFRLGWSRTWEAAARRFGDLHPALAECRDFLEAVRAQVALRLAGRRAPRVQRLAQAWLACHGLLGVLSASDRWHRLRPNVEASRVPPDLALPAVLGEVVDAGNTARELLTPQALAAEGEAMHHCVGSYWPECVAGDRIFALQLSGGERATAQYRPHIRREGEGDTTYRLGQLRGPHNREVSGPMRAWAEAVQERLNAPGLEVRRRGALEARGRLEGAQREWRLARPEKAAWLDAKSLRQLKPVLAWLDLQAPTAEVWLSDFIAGYPYHAGPQVEDALRVNDALTLVREPDNPHDPLAVRIEWRGHTLGYLPRPANAELAEAMDQGERFTARIHCIDRNAAPRERVAVMVLGSGQRLGSLPGARGVDASTWPSAPPRPQDRPKQKGAPAETPLFSGCLISAMAWRRSRRRAPVQRPIQSSWGGGCRARVSQPWTLSPWRTLAGSLRRVCGASIFARSRARNSRNCRSRSRQAPARWSKTWAAS